MGLISILSKTMQDENYRADEMMARQKGLTALILFKISRILSSPIKHEARMYNDETARIEEAYRLLFKVANITIDELDRRLTHSTTAFDYRPQAKYNRVLSLVDITSAVLPVSPYMIRHLMQEEMINWNILTVINNLTIALQNPDSGFMEYATYIIEKNITTGRVTVVDKIKKVDVQDEDQMRDFLNELDEQRGVTNMEITNEGVHDYIITATSEQQKIKCLNVKSLREQLGDEKFVLLVYYLGYKDGMVGVMRDLMNKFSIGLSQVKSDSTIVIEAIRRYHKKFRDTEIDMITKEGSIQDIADMMWTPFIKQDGATLSDLLNIMYEAISSSSGKAGILQNYLDIIDNKDGMIIIPDPVMIEYVFKTKDKEELSKLEKWFKEANKYNLAQIDYKKELTDDLNYKLQVSVSALSSPIYQQYIQEYVKAMDNYRDHITGRDKEEYSVVDFKKLYGSIMKKRALSKFDGFKNITEWLMENYDTIRIQNGIVDSPNARLLGSMILGKGYNGVFKRMDDIYKQLKVNVDTPHTHTSVADRFKSISTGMLKDNFQEEVFKTLPLYEMIMYFLMKVVREGHATIAMVAEYGAGLRGENCHMLEMYREQGSLREIQREATRKMKLNKAILNAAAIPQNIELPKDVDGLNNLILSVSILAESLIQLCSDMPKILDITGVWEELITYVNKVSNEFTPIINKIKKLYEILSDKDKMSILSKYIVSDQKPPRQYKKEIEILREGIAMVREFKISEEKWNDILRDVKAGKLEISKMSPVLVGELVDESVRKWVNLFKDMYLIKDMHAHICKTVINNGTDSTVDMLKVMHMISEMARGLGDVANDRDDKMHKLEALSREYTNLMERFNNMKREMEEKENKWDKLIEEKIISIDRLEKELEKLKSENKEITIKQERIAIEINSKSTLINKKDERITRLETELNTLRQEKDSIIRESNDHKEKVTALLADQKRYIEVVLNIWRGDMESVNVAIDVMIDSVERAFVILCGGVEKIDTDKGMAFSIKDKGLAQISQLQVRDIPRPLEYDTDGASPTFKLPECIDKGRMVLEALYELKKKQEEYLSMPEDVIVNKKNRILSPEQKQETIEKVIEFNSYVYRILHLLSDAMIDIHLNKQVRK